MKKLLFGFVLIISCKVYAQKEKIKELLSKITVEEKVT